jgi:hypothetical protein
MANDAGEKMGPQRKISRDEWDRITSRHATGESLARIAHDYQCTAPAIRYIIQKNRKTLQNNGTAAEPPQIRDTPGGTPVLLPAEVDSPLHLRPPPQPNLEKIVRGSFNADCLRMVILEFSEFLVASDAVTAEGTAEAFDRLRERTDSLLRLAARVRIEVERFRVGGGARSDERKTARSGR